MRNLTEKLEMKVIKAIRLYMKFTVLIIYVLYSKNIQNSIVEKN